jgi:hypothetical protein
MMLRALAVAAREIIERIRGNVRWMLRARAIVGGTSVVSVATVWVNQNVRIMHRSFIEDPRTRTLLLEIEIIDGVDEL